MIDTVLLRRASRLPLPKTALQKFKWRNDRYYFRNAPSANSPCCFYYPSPDGKYYLSIEASLPKILYGHNITVLTQTEVRQALLRLSDLATAGFEFNFDATGAQVARVDFCHNFNVGADKIHAYLRAATEARPPRLKRRVIGKIETVEFFNASRKIYLYDKSRQTAALLRQQKISPEAARSASGLIRINFAAASCRCIKRV